MVYHIDPRLLVFLKLFTHYQSSIRLEILRDLSKFVQVEKEYEVQEYEVNFIYFNSFESDIFYIFK